MIQTKQVNESLSAPPDRDNKPPEPEPEPEPDAQTVEVDNEQDEVDDDQDVVDEIQEKLQKEFDDLNYQYHDRWNVNERQGLLKQMDQKLLEMEIHRNAKATADNNVDTTTTTTDPAGDRPERPEDIQ